jgi:hypothetical protein
MPGDYSRVRFAAQSGYIGVLEQQGRVRLDADGNELVESLDRRRRAESIDTIGHGVVPLTTAEGFHVQEPVAGQWTIGSGRAYVDGILVDCWGSPKTQDFQADLGELRSPNPLPFTQQPFYYTPSFPSPSDKAPAIIYLDVWEREVTALERPDLIDPALEGIDTTTRLQAAWQVKALALQNAATSCTDDPPEWKALTKPSTGVLSTATTAPTPSGSPCTIDPAGGYTGLENRLYRVQISLGTPGGASGPQFVWSQDNASVGAVLLSITSLGGGQCQLAVSTVGRDKTLGFQVNDTLEVLDDFVEWSIRETNTSGTFVTVKKVDSQQLTLTVTPDISGAFTVVPAQNPRVRRWDGAPQAVQYGVAIPLGTDGVTVTFGPGATATFHAGDYWVFYARTATGTIEVLHHAPPRGVLHHYMRLALVNPPQPVQDCRQFWPPPFGEGCCTVVVKVGDDIQKAIDSLPPQGGCVCLKAGVHLIQSPIQISGRSGISLHGESLGAVVQNQAGGAALQIGDGKTAVSNISVEGITFTVAPGQAACITIFGARACAVRGCQIGPGASVQGAPLTLGFFIVLASRIEIRDNQVTGVFAGVLAAGFQDLTVAGNGFAGPSIPGSDGGPTVSGGAVGIELFEPAGGMVNVAGNEFVDFTQGIYAPSPGAAVTATALPLQLSIERNLVVRHALIPQLIGGFGWPTDPGTLSALLQQKAYGLFTDIPNAAVSGNTINLADPGHGGIIVAGSGTCVCGNVISSSVTVRKLYDWPSLPVGIVAYKPMATGAVDRCRIAENILSGPLKGIAVLAESDDAIDCPAVSGNRIDNGALDLTVEAIDLTDPLNTIPTLSSDLTALDHAFGILMINAGRAAVDRNVVSTCTTGIASIYLYYFVDSAEVAAQLSLASVGNTFDGNDVDSSTIGILIIGESAPVVRDGTMPKNQAAIVLYNTDRALVAGNRCWGAVAVANCLDLDGFGDRFEGNFVRGGATGMLALFCEDQEFSRNQVEATEATGIMAVSCSGETGFVENRLSFCGSSGQSAIEQKVVGTIHIWAFGQSVSAGIAVVNCSGVMTVDGCAVTDTGQVADSRCADIIVLGGAHVRVRNCRVVRTRDGAETSRALLLQPYWDDEDPSLATADASGNHVDVTCTTTKGINFAAAEIDGPASRYDIIFVGNMILQRQQATGNLWVVSLSAESLAITGNRIMREAKGEAPSLVITYSIGLSYVGNVVTQGADIKTTNPSAIDFPTPDKSFNANVPR